MDQDFITCAAVKMLIPALISRWLTAILAAEVLLIPSVLADEFTNPSNSVPDLAVSYTLGQSVTVTWNCSLSYITLLVAHWGAEIIGSLLTDAQNSGTYTWIIGQTDNINVNEISNSSNFVLEIRDPSGRTGTGDGFINGTLQSRGFRITSSASSISSTSSSTATSSSTSACSSSPSVGLSLSSKAGIGIGIGIGAIVLIAICVGLAIFFTARRRNTHDPNRELTQLKTHSPPYVVVNPARQYSELSGAPIRLELGAER
ncbi:hypothetical protein V8E54_014920 [Elaphomyces granulatus]